MSKNSIDRKPFVGVDLGGTGIKVGIVDRDGAILVTEKTKTKADEGSDAIVKRIVKTVREAMEEAGLGPRDIGGLGIGAPGTIDFDKGVVVNATNLRWNKFPLGKLLGDELKMPVVVDNDVNVGTWGEYIQGAGKGHEDLLGVFVGTGIGGGVVLNGKLYRGHFATAGEIGHTILLADAPRGRRSLENLASRTAIVNLLAQLVAANHKSRLTQISGGDVASVRSKGLAQAVEQDDDLAIEVLRQAAHYVGVAIANYVTVMSLPCVVVGGGLTEALGKRWVEWVRESFEAYVFPPELRACKIVAGKLGDDAGVLGAAALARGRVAKRD